MIRTAIVVLLALASALSARANDVRAAKDIHVAADGSGDYKTLTLALKAAVPGDFIVIKKPGGMVGAVLAQEGGAFAVRGTVPGSPAEAAGVKAGDKILSVDGQDISGLQLAELVARIRGPVGAAVVLKIAPADGSASRDVSIIRGETRLPVKSDADKLDIARSEKDDAAYFETASVLARGGSILGQSSLAFAYYNGMGTDKNPKQAARWAQLAANGGDAAAERFLGSMYFAGIGVDKDPALFVSWTRAAVEKGDSTAMTNLSMAYERGLGVTKDPSAALQWARRAAAPSGAQSPENIARAQAAVARLEPLVPGASQSGSVSATGEPAKAPGTAPAWWETTPDAGGAPSPAPETHGQDQKPQWQESK